MLTETWKEELAEKRERIMALDQMKLLDNTSILKRKDGNHNKNNRTSASSLSISGSFRKLEVD